MPNYKILSADSHVVEPPDIYTNHIDPEFRDRAPRLERRTSTTGREYDAWFLGDIELIMTGAFEKAGQRFENPDQLDQYGIWDDVMKAAYDPHEMINALEKDGIWGAIVQPSVGLVMYRIPDSQLLAAINKAYNSWITGFCKSYPSRLKPIGCIDVTDIENGCRELERCASLGCVGAFIPTYPLPEKPYGNPIYERLWWTAQDLGIPLLLHIGTNRDGIPGCELTIDVKTITAVGESTFDHWVRSSLTAILFAGVFDRFPKLQIGTVEHEMGWIPHWLKQMDFIYVNRPAFRGKWKSKEGLRPSDYWRRNMFATFMEDDIGIRLRDLLGIETIMWGNDFPHHESTWPESMNFLDRIFHETSEEDRRMITSGNAARVFRFDFQ